MTKPIPGLQDIVHDAQYLLIVLIYLLFVYYMHIKIQHI